MEGALKEDAIDFVAAKLNYSWEISILVGRIDA
jgi:hypothetical protein